MTFARTEVASIIIGNATVAFVLWVILKSQRGHAAGGHPHSTRSISRCKPFAALRLVGLMPLITRSRRDADWPTRHRHQLFAPVCGRWTHYGR
jgi:hypothetical protein